MFISKHINLNNAFNFQNVDSQIFKLISFQT